MTNGARRAPFTWNSVPVSLKSLLKSTPLYPRWRAWRHGAQLRQDRREWEAVGRPVPPPHAVKVLTVLEHARRFGPRTFVETGTFQGVMIEEVQARFPQVFSVELAPAIYEAARQKFADRPHVTILQGDSATVLPELLTEISEPCLFWLDGHYSAGPTARGSKETPVVEELAAIHRHPVRGHVVLIDDARCFDGSHDYPTLAELERLAREDDRFTHFEVRDDVVRIW